MQKARSLAARPAAGPASNVHRLPMRRALPRPVATLRAAALVGAGLAAIAEHVVFCQLLRWHGLLTARLGMPGAVPQRLVSLDPALLEAAVLEPAEARAQGVFLAVAWLAVATGSVLLWRASSRAAAPATPAAFGGAMVAGWGAYQFIEGLLLHVVLGLHHVKEGVTPWLADGLYVVAGAMLAGIGWEFCRSRGAPPA